MDATRLEMVLARVGVIPVVELPDPDLAVELSDALLLGGVSVLEVTFRAAGAAAAIGRLRAGRPDMIVGAGTVLTLAQAEAALAAGASFLVSPGSNPAVIEFVLRSGGIMIPGVATPSEIEANLGRGLQLLKLFPAGVLGGTAYLRALRGPYRDVAFVPTGGVTASNLGDYLAEPNVRACGGTWIAPTAALRAPDFEAITRAARLATSVVERVRHDSEAATQTGPQVAARGRR